MPDAQQIRTVWPTPYIAVQDTLERLEALGLWPARRSDLCTGSPLVPGGRCEDCGRFHEGRNA